MRLFPESVPLEDLFTEAVARLFETKPGLCLAWLTRAGLLPSDRAVETVRVRSQRSFTPLEHQDMASRPDLLIEAYAKDGEAVDVVMIESKIGSKEGPEQWDAEGESPVFSGATAAEADGLSPAKGNPGLA